MTPDAGWPEVAALFERVVLLPPHERAGALGGADPAIRARVEALLAADGAPPPRVLVATPGELAQAVAADPTPSLEGWRVGPYRIRRELGRGGMGIVYLAERDDLGTAVALKLIPVGPASAQRVARFQREQVLHASLEHPHIARLLDGGVADDGTPWFVMEYVAGSSLDLHCDSHQLGLTERLILFEKVGSAVAYAHRNLVVHRDLKPSNILVTADGVPKLVDFGIAKLLAADGEGRSTITNPAGAALTLAYAAPEQLRAGPVTTATDVYQLGLVLHQLLTGVPPCDAQGRPLDPGDKLTGRLPARPSALAEMTVPATPGTPAAPPPGSRARRRRTTPARLARALAGDLDTIVLKALHPDPLERYTSAQELVDEVRRHRLGLPVLARPDSLGYRLGKLVRRHRGISALVTLVVLLALVAALGLASQARRIAAERDRADEFSHLLERLIHSVDPSGGGDSLSARLVLERTRRQAEARLAADPEVWGRLLLVVGRTYQNMGQLDSAVSVQQTAVAALERVSGARTLQSQALRSLGTALVHTNRVDEGMAQLWRSVRLAEAGGPAGAAELGLGLAELGSAYYLVDRLDSARTLLQRGLAVLATLPDSGGSDFDNHRVTLANLLLQAGELDEPERLLRAAVARLTRREGVGSAETLRAQTEMADVLRKKGELAAGAELAGAVLAARLAVSREPHPDLAKALLQHARAMSDLGSWDAADSSVGAAVGIWRTLGGDTSTAVAYAEVWQAEFHKGAGRVEAALALEQRALAKFRVLEGEQSADAMLTLTRLAHTEHRLGRVTEAERHFVEALAALDTSPAAEGRLIRPLYWYGELLAERDRCAEAVPALTRSLQGARKGYPPSHPFVLRPRRLLGECAARDGQLELAEQELLAAWRDAARAGEYARVLLPEVAAALVRLYDRWGRPELAATYRAAAGEARWSSGWPPR